MRTFFCTRAAPTGGFRYFLSRKYVIFDVCSPGSAYCCSHCWRRPRRPPNFPWARRSTSLNTSPPTARDGSIPDAESMTSGSTTASGPRRRTAGFPACSTACSSCVPCSTRRQRGRPSTRACCSNPLPARRSAKSRSTAARSSTPTATGSNARPTRRTC